MIKLAEQRLSRYPDRYINKVYGKEEAGGTSVIYLTSLPFDELGFKPVTLRPLPEYTWQALRLVPGIFLSVGGGLSALSWITHRRDRLNREQQQQENRTEPAEPAATEPQEEQQ
jgi:formate dehydrogenase iron-sulfur subunit